MGGITGTKRAEAQVSGATLSGIVTDPTGALVPNATITIRNTDTGATRTVTSNSEGFYSAPNLLPGNYEVKISAKGFSTTLQKGIVLTVSARQTYSPVLTVGKIDQTVVVSVAPPSVQTSSSTNSATVDGTTVRELPLNGRDWTSLATLEPGVLSVPNQATTGFSANKGNRGFGNQLSDGGHRPNENTYRINGMVINDYTNAAPGGSTGVNLGVDAIDQFSVLTSSYTSEYGRTSGAVIDAITKSGTNKLHGTAYFFDRDKIFDARNFFEPTRSPFRRIQFGAAAGAPIFKDKTFIFVDYEGIRQSQPVATTIKVPNAGARAAAVPSPSTSPNPPRPLRTTSSSASTTRSPPPTPSTALTSSTPAPRPRPIRSATPSTRSSRVASSTPPKRLTSSTLPSSIPSAAESVSSPDSSTLPSPAALPEPTPSSPSPPAPSRLRSSQFPALPPPTDSADSTSSTTTGPPSSSTTTPSSLKATTP
jgi:hypothetical protein